MAADVSCERIELNLVGDALEPMGAAVREAQTGPRGQIAHGARHEDLVGLCHPHDAGRCVDGELLRHVDDWLEPIALTLISILSPATAGPDPAFEQWF